MKKAEYDMRVIIIGYRNYSFTSDDGRQVEGTTLYVAKESRGITGREPVKTGVSKYLADKCGFYPEVGAEIEIEYNEKGKIENIYTVS